jgi:hypothetical protein
MKNNLKKLLPLLGVVCLSMTQAFADDYSSNSGQDTCAKMKSAVPPGVNCPCEDGPNVFINAAYTLWMAHQDGMAVGYANVYPAAGFTPTSVTQGSVAYPHWKLRSGFKVGIGAYLDHDCWDILANYTWFWNKNNNYNNYASIIAATAGELGGIAPLWLPFTNYFGAGVAEFTNIQSQWNNWFNRVDAQLGRAFYVGHYVSFRPFLGLVGAWDTQDFNVNSTVVAATTPAVTGETTNSANHQKWWGVGPYAGFNTSFIFTNDSCNEWSLFMDSGLAMPWGHYQTTATASTTAATGVTTALLNGSGNYWQVDPMLELALGLRWETTWSDCNEWSFLLQAAWEEQVWFGHNRMAILNTGNGGSNHYTMQGLTLKAEIDF